MGSNLFPSISQIYIVRTSVKTVGNNYLLLSCLYPYKRQIVRKWNGLRGSLPQMQHPKSMVTLSLLPEMLNWAPIYNLNNSDIYSYTRWAASTDSNSLSFRSHSNCREEVSLSFFEEPLIFGNRLPHECFIVHYNHNLFKSSVINYLAFISWLYLIATSSICICVVNLIQ